MAKLTKFTISPSGDLVYKTTGKLAPSNYIFRKNTVYKVGEDGVRRRVGSLSRKLTKTEAERIAKAEKNRNRRKAAKAKQPKQPSKPSKGKPKAPSKTQRAGTMAYGEDWDAFEDSDFPDYGVDVKEEFAQRVRDAAMSVAPPWLQARIQALSTAALWQAYLEDQYIFETYFKYHSPMDPPHKSNISLWVYQFVLRIEQYMGVKV